LRHSPTRLKSVLRLRRESDLF